MCDYPLSTISSKKFKYSSHSVYQRSACQSTAPALLNRAQYCHILKDQRVFIQLYYQGRIMETAYNQWIEFMGGNLYKRLHPKVTIILTNSDNSELTAILDRVKRTCPVCKVISILWLEQCFQAKNKVPFDQFVLDGENKSKNIQNVKNNYEQEEKFDISLVQDFLNNVAQDIDIQYGEFFKENKRRIFEYTTKTQNVQENQLIKAKDIDLGPNPNKKKVVRVENEKKKKRQTFNIRQEKLDNEANRPTKSLQVVNEQEEAQKSALSLEYANIIQQSVPEQENQKLQSLSFNLMMEKYLNKPDDSKHSIRGYSQHSRDQTKIIQKANNSHLDTQNNVYSSQLTFRNSKRSAGTCYMQKKSVTKMTNISKAIFFSERRSMQHGFSIKKISQEKRLETMQAQLQQFRTGLQRQTLNHLIVVSDSKRLSARIEVINQLNTDPNEIYLQHVNYHVYRNFLQQSPPQHKAYFLFNPHRALDRPLYFALTQAFSFYPQLVSYRLVEQVASCNEKMKNASLKTPKKLNCQKLRYIKEMNFQVNRELIAKKKIIFLQSQIPQDLLRQIVRQLKGELVSQQQYLMGKKADIVATNKSSIPDGSSLNISQDQLWAQIFPFHEETPSN